MVMLSFNECFIVNKKVKLVVKEKKFNSEGVLL